MKIAFHGREIEVGPAHVTDDRVFAAGDNTPQTAALLLGALERGSELVLQNTRLTPAERAAQVLSIAAVPPGDEPAVILFTSGTAGGPKAARLARENLETNARAANEVLQVEQRSRFLCAL